MRVVIAGKEFLIAESISTVGVAKQNLVTV